MNEYDAIRAAFAHNRKDAELLLHETVRGILADDGLWMDMGTPETYLQAHLDFPSPVPRIHPQARVSPRAFVDSHCVIGPGAAVEDGCRLQGCVVWPGVCVPSGTCAERRIFYCSPTDY